LNLSSKIEYTIFALDMARHISAQFRQEYIQAGQDYCSSIPTIGTLQTSDNLINNKRKDLSSSDLEIPSPKIPKSKLLR
jgi:hypothetical protein